MAIIPDPAVYGEQTAQALNAYQNAISNIATRRAQTYQQFGMTGQVDDNGNLTNSGIDPNNPYGALQTMMGQHGLGLQALYQSAGARGIGHLGLGAQALDRQHSIDAGALAGLGSQFTNAVSGLAGEQLGATQTYNNARVQAQRDAIARSIANGWFTTAAPQYESSSNYNNQQLAGIGSPFSALYGSAMFGPDQTTALAHQFGSMTPQQLASMGIVGSTGKVLQAGPGPKAAPKSTPRTPVGV